MTDFEAMFSNERVFWRGKPNFKCFLLESIFNPLLFVAIVWGCLDFTIMGTAFSSMGEEDGPVAMFLIPFFLIHLMPVWIYIFGVLGCVLRYKHTEYAVTERGIYVSTGFIARKYEMKPFTDLSHVTIHRGVFDNILGVGDVISTCAHGSTTAMYNGYGYGNRRHGHGHMEGINICNIADYQEVFNLIKQMQTDIYADTMYPNDMRPEGNHGYQTRYYND